MYFDHSKQLKVKIKAIITGATGMVGKGILLECLENENVAEILVVNRRPIGMTHPKLKEIIHKDFFDLSAIKDQLQTYNTCFFALGVSSFRMDESTYTRLTYDLTVNFAKAIENQDLVFCYVSGLGTDSSEKSSQMWARVKGKTENALLGMKFKDVYLFRPGFIKPMNGIKSSTRAYNIAIAIVNPIFPLLNLLFPKSITTTTNLAKAIIKVAMEGSDKKHLYNGDINDISKL